MIIRSNYLTNIRSELKDIVEEAARRSGFKVEYRDHPMPRNNFDPYGGYDPKQMVGYGSVYTNESERRDHSEFWEMFRIIERERGLK